MNPVVTCIVVDLQFQSGDLWIGTKWTSDQLTPLLGDQGVAGFLITTPISTQDYQDKVAAGQSAWMTANAGVTPSRVVVGLNYPAMDDQGRTVVALGSNTAIGLANVTVQNVTDDCATYRRSWLIQCPAQTITLRDICITNDLVGPTGQCFVVGSAFACASEATIGSELQIDMIDRDDVLGYFIFYGLHRSKLAGLTAMTGTFQAGEEIRGASCRSKALSVGSDYLEITFDRWDALGHPATFTDGETITGQTSGVTAVLATPNFTEGDFLFLQRFIKDEALYGKKSHEERPGGARQVPPGLYFRCAIYNAHATDPLWVDGTIALGKK
jgi:hypothetical protein